LVRGGGPDLLCMWTRMRRWGSPRVRAFARLCVPRRPRGRAKPGLALLRFVGLSDRAADDVRHIGAVLLLLFEEGFVVLGGWLGVSFDVGEHPFLTPRIGRLRPPAALPP